MQPHLITLTKVISPQRRADLFTRPRLLDLMSELLDDKLIIISAPAGYGKTSLLIDFATTTGLPVCWYSVDTLDSDLQRFAAYIIASLTQRFPSFGSQSSAALESFQQITLDQFVSILANEIYEHIHEHFLLILDDYHLVSEKSEIDEFVSRFVQTVGDHCHLVVSTRKLLGLPDLPLLVARSQVGGLGLEDLAFRPDEIQSLLLQKYHLSVSSETAQDMAVETEGWVTGLLLSAQIMWQGMTSRVRAARVPGGELYDYLALQVLEQQPAEIQSFLMRTSYFSEFDAELCQAVWGSEQDWKSLFEIVRQDNLFVLPLEGGRSYIRYHHLFSEFLQARFAQLHPEEVQPLLQRLVDVYVRQEDWEKAYTTCTRLDDPARLAGLLEIAGPSLLKYGRLETLQNWIDALPQNILSDRPALFSLKGVVSVLQGKVEVGLEWLDQAAAAQRSISDFVGLALTLVRRTYAYRYRGEYKKSLQDAQEAFTLADQSGLKHLRAEALKAVGADLYHMGQLEDAIEKMNAALAAYQALGDVPNQINTRLDLGQAYSAAGRYQLALENYRQMLVYWRQVHNLTGLANLLNNLGAIYFLTGEYEQALNCYEEGQLYARRSGYSRMEAYILCGIGEVYDDLNAFNEAERAYHQSLDIALQVNDRFLMFYLLIAQAEQSRLLDRLLLARQLFSAAEQLLEKSNSTYEDGLCLLEAGRLSLSEGREDEAAERLEKSARLFESGGQETDAALAYFYLAVAHHRLGLPSSALQSLQHAFNLTMNPDTRHVLVTTGQEGLALLESVQNSQEVMMRAKELLERMTLFQEEIPRLRRRLRKQASTIPFAPPKLAIHALGSPRVDRDGKPVVAAEWIHQRRVRELFFYLLSRPDGASREEICLIFWPDSPPSQLKLQFKNAVYRLRYSLGQEVILLDQERYWFNKALDYEYDVEVFQARLAQARSVHDNKERAAAYQVAVNGYAGSYLPDCEGSWVLPERERLSQMYMDGLLELGRLLLELGDYQAVLDVSKRALAEDICQEEAYRLAMQAYAGLGNRMEIFRLYENCRQILLNEAAAEPSQQTEELYKKLSN